MLHYYNFIKILRKKINTSFKICYNINKINNKKESNMNNIYIYLSGVILGVIFCVIMHLLNYLKNKLNIKKNTE